MNRTSLAQYHPVPVMGLCAPVPFPFSGKKLSGVWLRGSREKLMLVGSTDHIFLNVVGTGLDAAVVETDPPMLCHVDGDLFEISPVKVEVIPSALRILAPNPE